MIMGLVAALQFLTRIPIRLRREPSLEATVAWFPLAGTIIGLVVGVLGAAMWHLTPPLVAGALTVAVGLLVTGAFHEDGLADTADGFGGGWTVEQRLEIMKDSRHGTYGVAAMCTSIVVRILAFGSLTGPAVVVAAAVTAHTAARMAAVAVAATFPFASHRGLGADYGRRTSPMRAIAGLTGGTIVVAMAVGWWVAFIVPVVCVAALAVGLLAVRKIGGVSGDVLGAVEQVAECAALITISALASRHALWWP